MWRRGLVGVLVLTAIVGIAYRTAGTLQWHTYVSATGPAPSDQLLLVELLKVLPAVCWTAVGCVLAVLRPSNVLGWLFLAAGVMLSFVEPGRGALEPVDDDSWSYRVSDMLNGVVLIGLLAVVLPLYPDGRLPTRRWRPIIAAAAAGLLLVGVGSLLATPLAIAGAVLLLPSITMGGITAMRRWEREVYPYRQQLAWLAGCAFVPDGLLLAARLVWRVDGDRAALLDLLFDPLTVVPIGVAVGVLRYRLLGIRTVLRRGLVYGTLTALVFIVYLVVTAVLGSALENRPLPGVLAAAVVAAVLAPARDQLQRLANRLVNGDRRDPLDALAGLSSRVAVANQAGLLPAALAAVAAAVHADGATVISPSGQVVARTGAVSPESVLLFPLRYGGKEIGELRVANARDSEPRLLGALAAQIAVVAFAAELTEALESERNRVVAATRDERDRLRQDLHDSLGPSLTGMSLGLQALARQVPDTSALALVERLRAETDLAVLDIRRLIDGLRPAVLDTEGLAEAIGRHARTLSAALPVDVTAGDLPALAPDVEAAAYRIVAEALSNAARHANAHHARVVISASDALHIAVTDDGHGIPAMTGAGVGLTSMRHRAESLGGDFDIRTDQGGTTVTATLPLRNKEA